MDMIHTLQSSCPKCLSAMAKSEFFAIALQEMFVLTKRRQTRAGSSEPENQVERKYSMDSLWNMSSWFRTV